MTTEERLEKLERELTATQRRNRWTLGCGAVLILGCLTIAATPGDNRIIRANSFILEDENGKTRASLSMGKDRGGPGLAMYDENGKTRAVLDVSKNGPALNMQDENGNLRASMGVGKDGPLMVIWDGNGKGRAAMVVIKDVPELHMMDKNGKPIWKAP
ncbi:MAG: hypothetical protein WC497_06215 [Patescibacteria group bacterium]